MSWGDRMLWGFGQDYNSADVEGSFQVSLENGINFIDTAEVYGNGRSERLLGQFLKSTKTPVSIATKFFPMPWRFTKSSVTRALRGSLQRLGLEHVDLTRFIGPALSCRWKPMLKVWPPPTGLV